MAADVTEQLDDDEAQGLAFAVWSFKQGEMMAVLIHLGDRLGLYRAMAGAGPLTPGELAERAGGLAERWVREWVFAQAAMTRPATPSSGPGRRWRRRASPTCPSSTSEPRNCRMLPVST